MGTRLYLGNLPHRARDRDVERFFKGYGRIRDVVLKNGYGFVEFDDYRDADDAVYELNGKSLLGERVLVEKARGSPRRGGGAGGGGGGGGRRDFRDNRGYGGDRDRGNGGGRQRGREKYGPPVRTENKLIVENLSSRVSWQDLKDYMRQAGEVTYADAHRPHKNEGVVEFANYSDMKNALEKLDDTEINGRRIKLVEDKPRRGSKRSRSRSRSPSGSRSRSRSRSRSNRSKSNSRSRSRSRSVSRSRSRSRSPIDNNRDKERDAGSDKDD